ncbi:MAG TPA: gluconate 2-dehydrogenase subunit 3 family protein [Opitutaceae bacterium]|nr:gluconate 2-dehydrogenase subunit 3 family protein [Opitutaceae bacterium]
MNRRELIRNLGVTAAATVLWQSLPVKSWGALPATAGWTEVEEGLLTAIGDTLLPTTADSPGAASVHVGRFVTLMLTDCHSPETTLRAKAYLERFQSWIRTQHSGGSFGSLTASQREKAWIRWEEPLLASPSSIEINRDAVLHRTLKGLLLLGYFSSEPGATQALRYDPVPGAFRGDVPLGPADRAWAM